MTIASAQIVYLVGPNGTGKSFTGDYLQVVHGYKHVDGDGPLKHCAVKPEWLEMSKNAFAGGKLYYEEIGKQTVDAAKDHDKVVLAHVTLKQEARDVVIETIVKGGVPMDRITIIELTIDKTVKLRYLYHRSKILAEQNGITIEDFCKGVMKLDVGELTEEKFVKGMMENEAKNGGDDGWEDCPMAKKVDVSGRDISHCDNVDKALGLTRSSDWTYESICAKVLPLDKERDADFVANGSMDLMGEIITDLSSNPEIKDEVEDTEEVKELKKKRRSTIIKTKSWKDIDFGKIDLEADE